jgi:hypothetical protein
VFWVTYGTYARAPNNLRTCNPNFYEVNHWKGTKVLARA